MHHASPWMLGGFSLILAVCAGATGCSRSPAQPQKSPLPNVTASYPLQCEVTDYNDYTGRTAAIDTVQITPRVTGYLDKIEFKDGVDVVQGAVLYEIDPRPYQAQNDAAIAQLAESEANLQLANANNQRFKLLARKQPGAVTPQQLDQYQAQEEQAVAAVNVAKANLATAKLNLGWTKVISPIGGRLSRTLVTRGNLVVADQTVLTNIVSQDPIYAYFDVDELTALRIQRLLREGKFQSARQPGVLVPAYLGLTSEQGYPHQGHVDFVNNQLNTATATLQLRAVFANSKPSVGPRLLSPGLFVRIRIPVGTAYQALLVLEGAIQTDQNLKFVYLVDRRNRVVRRDVKLGTQHAGLRVIAKGLTAGDRVIINGLQHVRPEVSVRPALVPMPIPSPGALSGIPCGAAGAPAAANPKP